MRILAVVACLAACRISPPEDPTCESEVLDSYPVHFVNLVTGPLAPTKADSDPDESCDENDTGWPCSHLQALDRYFRADDGNRVCDDDGHCIRFHEAGITFAEDVTDPDCLELVRLANLTGTEPDFPYALDLLDQRFLAAFQKCHDPDVVSPDALNIFVIDNPYAEDGTSFALSVPSLCIPVVFISVERLPRNNEAAEEPWDFTSGANQHEVGHAFGLSHQCLPQTSDTSNPMQSTASGCCCECSTFDSSETTLANCTECSPLEADDLCTEAFTHDQCTIALARSCTRLIKTGEREAGFSESAGAVWTTEGATGGQLSTILATAGAVAQCWCEGKPAEPEADIAITEADDGTSTETAAALVAGETFTYAGFAVAGPGDLDGDGWRDVVVGAPYAGETGSAYVMAGPFLREDSRDLTDAVATIVGPKEGRVGFALAGTGTGLAVGAPGSDKQEALVGVFQNPVVGELDLSSADGLVRGDLDIDAGGTIAAPDLDGDGAADLAIGARGFDGIRGAIFLFPGPLVGEVALDAAPAILLGQDPEDLLGSSFAAAGDLDGDGVGDLVVGIPTWAGGSGGALIFHGPVAAGSHDAIEAADAIVEGDGALLGTWVDGGGDSDQDGYADLLLSSHTGPAYVVPGPSASGPIADVGTELYSDEVFAIARFAGDVDGDGGDDVILGSPSASEGRGLTWFVSSGDLGGKLDLVKGAPHLIEPTAYASFGTSLGPAGDVDGDGRDDFVVGAPAWQARGAAYVVLDPPIF